MSDEDYDSDDSSCDHFFHVDFHCSSVEIEAAEHFISFESDDSDDPFGCFLFFSPSDFAFQDHHVIQNFPVRLDAKFWLIKIAFPNLPFPNRHQNIEVSSYINNIHTVFCFHFRFLSVNDKITI